MAAVYNFEIEKIHDTVWVFRKALKNPEKFVEYFQEAKDWKDWYIFGEHAEGTNFDVRFESFPTPEEWEHQKDIDPMDFKRDLAFENEINDLFYNATKQYVEANNISFDNWVFEGSNIAKYHTRGGNHEEYAMVHHTDYQREFAYNPGSKFGITAVFYLNDNYEGGDVLFRFLDDDDVSIIKEEYTYKPSAGDIVVFMSGHPHYHGVKAVTSGEKYIVRTYWRYRYPGHPLWLKLQEKYGEDVWGQLEAERLKFNRDSDNITMINNIPFWVEFEEYYKKEIESLDI